MIKNTLFRIAAAACALVSAQAVQAQDMYVGQVFTVGFAYCPTGSLEANGATLTIGSNPALFSLYGTTYGGNGSTNFNLPDLRGRSWVGQGTGPSLSPMTQGGVGGVESVVLSSAQLPAHTHTATLRATTSSPSSNNPSGLSLGTFPAGSAIYATGTPTVSMSAASVQLATAGSSSPVALRDPYLVLRNCVVTSGIFPSHP